MKILSYILFTCGILGVFFFSICIFMAFHEGIMIRAGFAWLQLLPAVISIMGLGFGFGWLSYTESKV